MNSGEYYLGKAFEVAGRSLQKGNLPFGCILVDKDGKIIEEGENTVITSGDAIAHCEINLIHHLAGKYEWSYLNQCTLYATTEPCPMCVAAIFWSGIGRLAYAMSKEGYHDIAGTTNPDHIFNISSRKLLENAGRKTIVDGPLMEEEAMKIYRDWLAAEAR